MSESVAARANGPVIMIVGVSPRAKDGSDEIVFMPDDLAPPGTKVVEDMKPIAAMPDGGPISIAGKDLAIQGEKTLRITPDMISNDGRQIIDHFDRDQAIGGGQFGLTTLMMCARSVDILRRLQTASHRKRILTLATGYVAWMLGRDRHGFLGRLITDPKAAPQQPEAQQALAAYLFAPSHRESAVEKQLRDRYIEIFPARYRKQMLKRFQFLRQEVFARLGGDQEKTWRDFIGAEASLADGAGPLWTEIERAKLDDPAVAQQQILAAQNTLHRLSQTHVLAAILTAYVATQTPCTDRIPAEVAEQMSDMLELAHFAPVASLLQAKADSAGQQAGKRMKAFLELIEPGRFGPEDLAAQRDHALTEIRVALGMVANPDVAAPPQQSDRKPGVRQIADRLLALLQSASNPEEAVRKLLLEASPGGTPSDETDRMTPENVPASSGSGWSDEQVADALYDWISPKLAAGQADGQALPSETSVGDVLDLRDRMNQQEQRLTESSRRAAAKEAVLSWMIDNGSADSVRILDQACNLAAHVIATLAAGIGEDTRVRPDAPVSGGDLNRALSTLMGLNPNDYLSPGFTDPHDHADELVHWSLDRVAATAAARQAVNALGDIVNLVSAARAAGSNCTFVVVNRSVPAMIKKWKDDGAKISKTPVGEWHPDFIVFTESSGATQSQLQDFHREFIAPLLPSGGFAGEYAFPGARIPILLTESDVGTLSRMAILSPPRLKYCKLPVQSGAPADRMNPAFELVAALAGLPIECLGYVDIDQVDIDQQMTMNTAGFILHDRMPVLEWARHALKSNNDENKKAIATAVLNQIATEQAALPVGANRHLDPEILRIQIQGHTRTQVELRTRDERELAIPDPDRARGIQISDGEAIKFYRQLTTVVR